MRLHNATTVEDGASRRPSLAAHLGAVGERVSVRAPLHLDYGCVLLDVCTIRFGAKTRIGPGVQLHAADHPREAADRETGHECGAPITVGRNVRIGGHAVGPPGVTIVDDAVVGAGSVATRDVPAGATVVGDAARATRS